MDVVVFGAGSLGSLIGGLLAPVHSVTLVGRDPHVDTIQLSGLAIDAQFNGSENTDLAALEETVSVEATTDGRNLTADLALVTVKAFDTETAAETLATGSFDAVCSLQNGMGNESTLAATLDCPVLAGTTTYGAMLQEPGRVACTGLGEIVIGARDGGDSPIADSVGEAFTTAGLNVTVADDMPYRLWKKLAVNAGINAVTALARVTNGALLDGPANDLARQAARETARVARADGVILSNRAAVSAVEPVAEDTAANRSSMHQDVSNGRRTEIDAINGFVLDRASELAADGSLPEEYRPSVNETLTALCRAWERGQGLR